MLVDLVHIIFISSYLKETLPYIDDKHVAIFGWSYGGYVSALALASEENVFSCGISVAPVTSWLYYGKIIIYFMSNKLIKLCNFTLLE